MRPPTIHACPVCGQETTRRAIDLGKTDGEEGHDFVFVHECPVHGEVRPVETPVPCLICGKTSTVGVVGTEILDGYDDYIPGMDSVFGLCDCAGCHAELHRMAAENLEQYAPAPKLGDYISRGAYTAKPDRMGFVHRLQCRCGELADGTPYYVAECGDSTYYRCPKCLPKK